MKFVSTFIVVFSLVSFAFSFTVIQSTSGYSSGLVFTPSSWIKDTTDFNINTTYSGSLIDNSNFMVTISTSYHYSTKGHISMFFISAITTVNNSTTVFIPYYSNATTDTQTVLDAKSAISHYVYSIYIKPLKNFFLHHQNGQDLSITPLQ